MAEPESLVTQQERLQPRACRRGRRSRSISMTSTVHWHDDLASGLSRPIEIVVVGHFDDRRSSSCPRRPAGGVSRSIRRRSRRLGSTARRSRRASVDLLDGCRHAVRRREHIIDAVRPGVTILSAVACRRRRRPAPDRTGARRRRERPASRSTTSGSCASSTRGARRRTCSSTRPEASMSSRLTARCSWRSARRASRSRRHPRRSPVLPGARGRRRTPSACVEFKDDSGRKAFVAIVDASGLLESVAEGVPDAAIGDGAFEGFFRDPSGAHRYRLRWTTTICDREMTVSIAREVARIVIEHAPREGCDAMGIGRDLVLEFSQDVDPADVELQVIQPALLPEPPPEPTTMVVELRPRRRDRVGPGHRPCRVAHGGACGRPRPEHPRLHRRADRPRRRRRHDRHVGWLAVRPRPLDLDRG